MGIWLFSAPQDFLQGQLFPKWKQFDFLQYIGHLFPKWKQIFFVKRWISKIKIKKFSL